MKDGFSFICGRDTTEFVSQTFVPYTKPYLSHDSSRRIVLTEKNPEYKYKVDPNVKVGKRIESLSELQAATKAIYQELALESPVTSRIDICFDDYEHEYRDLLMITQLLFILVEKYLGITNDYISNGITITEPKTIRFQNSSWEAEFYNKAIQEPHCGVKSRLELRRKRLKNVEEAYKEIRVITRWMKIFENATHIKKEEYDALMYEINDAIMTSYELDVRRGDYRKRDYNSLIQRYHYHIFSGRQLTDLFSRLGYKHPDVMASKYKKRHRGMEFFKIQDLQGYVCHIQNAAYKFFLT